MEKKEILHQLLMGMDGHLSCGVPLVLWELAAKLTKEVYGEDSVDLLNRYQNEYDAGIDRESLVYTIDGCYNPNCIVGSVELISMLEGDFDFDAEDEKWEDWKLDNPEYKPMRIAD